jgi:hypothetical protein
MVYQVWQRRAVLRIKQGTKDFRNRVQHISERVFVENWQTLSHETYIP